PRDLPRRHAPTRQRGNFLRHAEIRGNPENPANPRLPHQPQDRLRHHRAAQHRRPARRHQRRTREKAVKKIQCTSSSSTAPTSICWASANHISTARKLWTTLKISAPAPPCKITRP